MSLTKFDKETIRKLRVEMDEVLKTLADKYGIQIKAGNATFSENLVTLKVDCSILKDGKAVTKEAEAFLAYAKIIGLDPSDLGREFSLNNKTYKVLGFQPRKEKFPMICEDTKSGKMYRLPEDSVVAALKKK
jgi:hypothetical protein